MHRTARRFRLAVPLALLLGGCEVSCSAGQDAREKLERNIAEELGKRGVEVTAACPEPGSEPFTCEAKTAEGRAIVIDVKRAGTRYAWETRDVAIGPVMAEKIRASARDSLGLALDELRCPPVVWPDTPVECTGSADGVEIPLRVDLARDKFEPTGGVVLGPDTARAIADEVERKIGARPEVDCGFQLRPSTPGATFTCDLALPDGAVQKIYVSIEDTKGNIHFTSTPP